MSLGVYTSDPARTQILTTAQQYKYLELIFREIEL